jgi:hypothetical protein
MNPDSVLRTLINAALRGAVYKILWRTPMAVSWIIVALALAYVILGHR